MSQSRIRRGAFWMDILFSTVSWDIKIIIRQLIFYRVFPRVMNSIVTKEHKALAGKLKQVLATYSEAEDLINIGAYKNGSNPDIDYAIRKNKEVNEFLCQDTEEKFAFDEEVELLKKVFDD